MAKKKQSKKRRQQARASSPARIEAASVAIAQEQASAAPQPAGKAPRLDYRFVSDLKKFFILSGLFILIELVIWYLFNHTAVGPQVYNLIRL